MYLSACRNTVNWILLKPKQKVERHDCKVSWWFFVGSSKPQSPFTAHQCDPLWELLWRLTGTELSSFPGDGIHKQLCVPRELQFACLFFTSLGASCNAAKGAMWEWCNLPVDPWTDIHTQGDQLASFILRNNRKYLSKYSTIKHNRDVNCTFVFLSNST